MIEVSRLNLEWPQFRLGPLELTVPEGAYCVLLGPSGAGKSSLLEWLAGFRPATSGELRIKARTVTEQVPGERDVALVFQEPALFPHLTAAENIKFALRMSSVSEAETEERVRKLAERFQIVQRLGARPSNLSRGEAQRVALARVLACPPSVLLLDEPLSAVDDLLHRELLVLLKEIHEAHKLTTLHVTHSLVGARNLATHVGVLIDGQLRQFGEAASVFRRPVDQEAARALGVVNFVEGALGNDKRELSVEGVRLPVAEVNGEGKKAVLSRLRWSASEMGDALRARVLSVEVSSAGASSARVRLDDCSIELAVSVEETTELSVGTEGWVEFSSAQAELYE